jgi:ankyrin repeat protein
MCRDGRIDALQFLLHWCSEHPARGPTLLATDHLCDLLQHALGQKQMLVVDLIFSRLGRSLPVPVEDSDTSSDALLFDKMLENAVKCSHREIVKILIDSGKCDVNREIRTYISDITLRHPLLSLAHDPAVVRLLLDAKAVVNREGCETVFQASCTQFSFDSVMMLLEANADVNGGGPWALSALQWAARAPCTDEQADEKADILELLIDAGANTIRMWKSDSILEMCMNSGTSANRVVTAQTLLANVPSLWIHGYWRETPLMLACKTYIRDPAQFRGLIDAGDDANARDKYGVSVLGYLFKHANNGSGVHSARKTREILHMLLDQGANPLLDATGNGCTVLMLIVLRATNCFGGNGADYPNAANTAFISDILEFILHHPDIHSLTVDDTVDDPPCLQQSKRAKRCRMGNAICGAVRGIADAVARLLG